MQTNEPLAMTFKPPQKTIEHSFSLQTDRIKTIVNHPNLPIRMLGLHSGTIIIMSNTEMLQTFSNSPAPVRSIKFNSIGNVLAIAGDDKQVRIYSFECMNLTLCHIFKHTDYVRCLEFHPYLPYLISGSDDQTIKIFNYQSGKKLETLNGHTSYVMDLKCNNNLLYSVGMDTTLRVWNIPAFSMSRNLNSTVTTCDILEAHYKGVTSLVINKTHLVTGSDDYTIKIFDLLALPTFRMTLNYHTKPITSLVLTKKHLISGGEDGKVIFYNQNFRYENEIVFESRVWSLSVNEKDRKLAIGTDNGLVVLEFDESGFNPNLFVMAGNNLLYIEEGCLKITDFLTAFQLIELAQEVIKIDCYKNYISLKYADKLVLYELSSDKLIENKILKEIQSQKGDIYFTVQNEMVLLINENKQTVSKIKGPAFDYKTKNTIIKNQILEMVGNDLYLNKLIISEKGLNISPVHLILGGDIKKIDLKSVLDIKSFKDDLVYIICKDSILIFIKILNDFVLEKVIKCNVRAYVIVEFILFVSTDKDLFALANTLMVPIKGTPSDIIGFYFYDKTEKAVKQVPATNIKELIEFISSDLKFYLIELKGQKLNKFVCNLNELAFKMEIKFKSVAFEGEIKNKIPLTRFHGEAIINFIVENGRGFDIIEKLTSPKMALEVLLYEYKNTKKKEILVLAVGCIINIYASALQIQPFELASFLKELKGLNSSNAFTKELHKFNQAIDNKLFCFKESSIDAAEAFDILDLIKNENSNTPLVNETLLNIIVATNSSPDNFNLLIEHHIAENTLDTLIKAFYNIPKRGLLTKSFNIKFITKVAILFKDKSVLSFILTGDRGDLVGNTEYLSIVNINNRVFLEKHMAFSLDELILQKTRQQTNVEKVLEKNSENKIKDLAKLSIKISPEEESAVSSPEDADEEWEKEVEKDFIEGDSGIGQAEATDDIHEKKGTGEEKESDESTFESYDE
ncbi:Coatomer subunit beta'-3 [Cucumispora dikerogammari]|nr:Coatomer subunit beta'-3 [Cucumispora dikerogammari]